MNLDKKSKWSLLISLMGFSIWFGANILRSNFAYNLLLLEDGMPLNQSISPENLYFAVRQFAEMFFYPDLGYGLFFIGIVLLLYFNRGKIKTHGWLMMASLFVLLGLPGELYNHYLDWRLINDFKDNYVQDIYATQIKDYFLIRFQDNGLKVFTVLSFLSNISAAICLIYKPLQRFSNKSENYSDET
jgi:hypothetical protein